MDCNKYNDQLLFIGRLIKQKIFFPLLDAVLQTNYELSIIGEGEEETDKSPYKKA
ncbi:MAG: hypothetical protein HOG49_37745 [Candidatus Scalindua sp.]|jgi:hypothetical protein|nr:hypothetical protein [Candidatus Scalindua sp.]